MKDDFDLENVPSTSVPKKKSHHAVYLCSCSWLSSVQSFSKNPRGLLVQSINNLQDDLCDDLVCTVSVISFALLFI